MQDTTTILCRDEAETQYIVGPREFRGYGHEFEKAYTIDQITGSTGHHRVISYRFCGLNFIVRYETDAYVDDPKTGSHRTDPEDDSISRMMQNMALSPSRGPEHTTIAGSKLRVKQGGKAVPLSSTLEIKTRAIKNPLSFEAVASQLWVSQTPNLVRAYHERGSFQKPQVENVAAQIQQWETSQQSSLGKLGWLMKRITALAKECGGRATVKYDVRGKKLVILRDEGRKMLPEDLYAKWDAEEPGAKAGGRVPQDADAASPAKQVGAGREERSSAIRRKESESDKTTVA